MVVFYYTILKLQSPFAERNYYEKHKIERIIKKGGIRMKEVPIWEKSNLTLEEAAAYSNIGMNKLRSLTDREDCEFVLWIGTKRLIKRRKLDEYIEKVYSI